MKQMLSTNLLMTALLSLAAHAEDCGSPGVMKGKINDETVKLDTRVFKDGSIAVRAPLSVNPDGSPGSYSVGDHGFTYIANGLSAWKNGRREPCTSQCLSDFKEAEEKSFSSGTSEFCVFAMEVEPFAPGQAVTKCWRGNIVGNGKGRLALGPLLDTVSGGKLQSYISTTSLRHMISGTPNHLNSELLPIAVSPRTDLLGKIVWIGGAGLFPTYAVIGDTGPAFGEGSIALHQLLREGVLTPQKSGPITEMIRCTSEEKNLKPPFVSRPDGGINDRCKAKTRPKTSSDIRAYAGLETHLNFVILGAASFPFKDGVINSTLTVESISQKADHAGYTAQKISAMLACLPK